MLPIKPNKELKKINIATVPLAPFVVVQAARIINGDKNIPPPVPVRPARNPIIMPVLTA